ncbi:MAG TPA: radical SAM protein [Candidatus Marinimicrobia bacterium]|nr:radical SAM protein [Candidatus Neomarinimicrobiota bacterium]
MRVAALHSPTYAFGNSPKLALWLQGCPHHCSGCIAPDWQNPEGGTEISSERLLSHFQKRNLEAIVISGGEPLLQYEALLPFLKEIHGSGKGIIIYSGYPFLQIERHFSKISLYCDLLISGPYIENLNSGKGLRGSENQQIHFFTQRYHAEKELFEAGDRQIELIYDKDGLLLCGIPPLETLDTIRRAAATP